MFVSLHTIALPMSLPLPPLRGLGGHTRKVCFTAMSSARLHCHRGLHCSVFLALSVRSAPRFGPMQCAGWG